MEEQANYRAFLKRNSWQFGLPFLLLIPVLLVSNQLYGVFGENNYVTIHLMIEIFIIVASLTIAIQAWLIFPYILSNYRLYIGALFLFIGLLEIIHTLAYKGMPFFITESSPYSASWFYMTSRIAQALGLLLIFTVKPKRVHSEKRRFLYSLACLGALVCIFIVYNSHQLLPVLVIEGEGTTALKKGLQYVAIVLQGALIVYLWRNFHANQTQHAMVIMASVYLIISDLMFTTYKSVYDIWSFMGHLFQLLGFYFLIKALYYASVEKPFQSLIKTQKQLAKSIQSLTVTQQKLEKSEAELHYMAYHDELTKLPNSRFFSEELTEELELTETKTAIIMIEIDRLKAINESLGHIFGDKMLQIVANRLRESLSEEHFISKRSGGEFTVILRSVKAREDIVQLCKHIQEIMKPSVQLQHFQLNVTLNMGIACYPENGRDKEELVKHAQEAMSEAKQVTERYLFYHSTMEKELVEHLILEQDLHHALAKGELHLEYQPQVNLATGHIYSVEALVRWKHPEKGWISPGVFIPIAEETGLIVPIGEWVLETACRQAKQWHSEGIEGISVAVNVSTRQFFQQNLVCMVGDILAKTNLSPQYLELEITESMTIDKNYALGILQDLKRLGITIAVDDFGTGYSSMSYLKDFPIDCLKIDRSFIFNIQSNDHDGALISMIISMAKHLQLKVVAEGVEEVDQLSFLTERNCDVIQGYLFSKPISPQELSENFYKIQQNAHLLTEVVV